MSNPTLRLSNGSRDLLISVDLPSWRVLTPSHFFSQGGLLVQAFGFARADFGSPKPELGVLQSMPVTLFRAHCQTVWDLLERDRELLSYSYTCQYVSPSGERSDASRAVFTVRGLRPALKDHPKGYCTLRLLDDSGARPGREAEVIDLRTEGKVDTDDGGHLTLRRRSMAIDWYREMPRILEFCEQNSTGVIEVRRHDT
jgi:hypothetical protein